MLACQLAPITQLNRNKKEIHFILEHTLYKQLLQAKCCIVQCEWYCMQIHSSWRQSSVIRCIVSLIHYIKLYLVYTDCNILATSIQQMISVYFIPLTANNTRWMNCNCEHSCQLQKAFQGFNTFHELLYYHIFTCEQLLCFC